MEMATDIDFTLQLVYRFEKEINIIEKDERDEKWNRGLTRMTLFAIKEIEELRLKIT